MVKFATESQFLVFWSLTFSSSKQSIFYFLYMLCVLTKNVQSCYCGIKKINSNALTIRSVSENLIKDGCYRALIQPKWSQVFSC